MNRVHGWKKKKKSLQSSHAPLFTIGAVQWNVAQNVTEKRISVLTLHREHVSVTCFCSEVILAHRLKGTDGKRLAVMPLQPLTSCCYNSFLTPRGGEKMHISPEVFFIKDDSSAVVCF